MVGLLFNIRDNDNFDLEGGLREMNVSINYHQGLQIAWTWPGR